MKYQVWETDGKYIQGKKLGRAVVTLKSARMKAEKIKGYHHLERASKKGDVYYWIEREDSMPIGLIQRIE